MNPLQWFFDHGLVILGSVAVTVVTLTWGLRGRFDALGTEIKLGRAETNNKIDSVMAETREQTIKIDHITGNIARVETNQKDHETKDETRFSDLRNLAIVQATHGKAIQVLEQQRRPGYTPNPFSPPKGHGT